MRGNGAILALEDLTVRLPAGADRPLALSDVTLSVAANEILCVVGESGSGKSVMANAIMRLLPPEVRIQSGHMMFEGRTDRAWRSDEDRTNTLVFIGRNLPESELRAGLRSCL